jgi:hypothetical protein
MKLFDMIDKIQVMDLAFLKEVPPELMTLRDQVADLTISNAALIKKRNNLELIALGLSIGLVILTITIIKKSKKSSK